MPVSILYKSKIIEIDNAVLIQDGVMSQNATVQDDALSQSAEQISISSISTDTRTLEKGALFVALKGDNHNGRAYVEAAIEKGAVACLVEENSTNNTCTIDNTCNEHDIKSLSIKFPHIYFLESSSALITLQEIATQYRNQFSIPVIGVTGSNGKTTTKNLIASVLRKKYKTISTKGNLNNHIGLPLSILSMEPDTEIAVLEAGINHIGEMSVLSAVLKPTAIVITNIGNAHIEFFGSQEAIAKEKAELARHAPAGSSLYIPYNDPFAGKMSDFVPHVEVIPLYENSDVIAELRKNNFKYINTPHVMSDVSLAIAIGAQYHVPFKDMVDGIIEAELEPGRFDIKKADWVQKLGGELLLIDDTYNANPDSVCGSLKAMHSTCPEHTLVLVLGQLKEQGEFLKEGYAKIMQTAEMESVSEIFLVGISADDCMKTNSDAAVRTHYFSSKQLCLDILTTYIEEKARSREKLAILVKGSRSSKMEDVVNGLLK